MSLYKFEHLERFLNNMGAPTAQGRSFQEIKRVLNTSIQRKEVELKSDGIFCTVDGYEHQGYIFNQKPDIERYKGKLPRFHIAQCDVVRNRKDLSGDYIWTNSEKVQLYDRGKPSQPPYPRAGELTVLELCGFCRSMVEQKVSTMFNTAIFHKYLVDQYEAAQPIVPVVTDIYGYTLDFTIVSRKIRKERGYICEKCDLDLSHGYDRQYLHVHHRNGNKTNNDSTNLECLCIGCHSEVDEKHTHNFASRINKRKLDEFNKRFERID